MKALSVHTIESQDHLVYPDQFTDIELSSAATSILADFKYHRPSIIEERLAAVDAAHKMTSERVKILMVVNYRGELAGVVTLDQLDEQSITQLVTPGETRRDVSVAQLMTPRAALKVICYEELLRASVGDLLRTFQRNGELCYLVVERGSHRIRGLVAACELAARLHCSVPIQKQPSFSDLVRAARPATRTFSGLNPR